MTLQPSTIVQPLAAGDAASLGRDGYLKLHQAVPPSWLAELRAIFDDNILPSERWPVPRGYDWEHAQLDLDPLIQRVCHLPDLLSGAAQIIAGPFFLAQVEGRAPRQHNMTQMLHRDAEGDTALHAVAFVYLDDYAAANGATQLVSGSHRGGTLTTAPVVMAGDAGDVIIMDARLMHGATTNHSGAPRRSLLISYVASALRAEHRATETIRGVRMDCSTVFLPADHEQPIGAGHAARGS